MTLTTKVGHESERKTVMVEVDVVDDRYSKRIVVDLYSGVEA